MKFRRRVDCWGNMLSFTTRCNTTKALQVHALHRPRHCLRAVSSDGHTERKRKPEWVRLLEEDAEIDEDVASVLDGADGDPDIIRENMKMKLQNKDFYVTREGTEELPTVAFREINPFKLWVWVEFIDSPSAREQELLESVVKAWFMLGKLGGFNTSNLQVFHHADDDRSFFDYSNEELEESMGSYLHDVGETEYRGNWARFRVDMGTCDELALDVMVNTLLGFSRDFCGLKKVYVGGVNRSWPVPEEEEEENEEDMYDIDPMKLPKGLDEELEMLDDLAPELEAQQKEQQRLQELLGRSTASSSVGSLPSASGSRPVPGTIEAAAAELRQQRAVAAVGAPRSTTSSSGNGKMLQSKKAAKAPWGTALARGSIMAGSSSTTSGQIEDPPSVYKGIGPEPPPMKAVKKSKVVATTDMKQGRAASTSTTAARNTSSGRKGGSQLSASEPSEEEGIQMYSQEEFERMFPNRGGQ
ncbi:hypothetical protein CEUSTIGMA_g10573.t1 [Chlamydomonas eustigma]|uniref:Uncharacterized protein n=1 Tax=Chlamydomonas eustigma TaxID=1157962 RepID=A0A250XJ97_9CHLO|nr:hypothetical protein CEUSTIGMA_g10573.t1 [Chlamydomonas eustigma]|eukprot:GAX83147.1 hypothetical protein CEUSTIGMA_g10573.t1 [Chlamydomonas eustigma]